MRSNFGSQGWNMLFFTGYKGVPKYQGDNNLLAKDPTSEILGNFGNHMSNKFPQVSTMNPKEIQLPRQVPLHAS
jgi:hypothetical protein